MNEKEGKTFLLKKCKYGGKHEKEHIRMKWNKINGEEGKTRSHQKKHIQNEFDTERSILERNTTIEG